MPGDSPACPATAARETSNYYLCDGANGTPNTIGKFLRGVSSGAGVANGGSDHTHYTEHNHDAASGPPNVMYSCNPNGDRLENWPPASHTHTLSNTAGLVSGGVVGGTANLIPPYRTLKFVMFTLPASGGPLKPWDLDTSISRIPSGLSAAKHSDGAPTNYTVIGLAGHHLKHAAAGADYTVGGTLLGSHAHGGDGHTHQTTAAVNANTDVLEIATQVSSSSYSPETHVHTTSAASWTRVDSANNEPPAINVLFCQRN